MLARESLSGVGARSVNGTLPAPSSETISPLQVPAA